MTQFATHADFAVRLGLTLTNAEQTRADTLLALASGIIQAEAKQTIARVTNDEISMPSTYSDRLRLKERPVVSVSSVTLTPPGGGSPATIDPNTYYVDGDELVRSSLPLRSEFLFETWGRGWLGTPWTIDIVYTHGYADADIPADIKAICMEMVVRVWVNPGSVARETIGNEATVYDNARFSPTGLLLTPDEKNALRRVVGRTTSAVVLR